MTKALDLNRTVTVACKLPQGIIIREYAEGSYSENMPGGGTRKVKTFLPVGPRVRIKGPIVPKQFERLVEIHGGYALTSGVSAKLWEQWIETNKDAPYVVNNLIFGHESRDRVIGWTKEHSVMKSGLEPLDVSMIKRDDRLVIKDERIGRNGADLVVDGALTPGDV